MDKPKVETLSGYQDLIGETLTTFTRDKENVHTKLIQQSVQTSIQRILEWGKDIPTAPNLPEEVLSKIPIEPSTVQMHAYNHLLECYDVTDSMVMFDTTYPRLCTLVWHRVKDNEHLLSRFFEEVSESSGLCLNGNMARLMNVFAGIDEDFSPQQKHLSKSQFQELISRSLHLDPAECMRKVLELCVEAELSPEATEEWIKQIRVFYNDLS